MVKNVKNKFDNHIYFMICEVALDLFKLTKYMTFIAYCRGMKSSIMHGHMSYSESKQIATIMARMELMFSLGDKKNGEYLMRFFCDDKFITFEEPVRLTTEYFKGSLN